MVMFDASKEWTILIPEDAVHAKKAAADLSRYIGLLMGVNSSRPLKPPVMMDAAGPAPAGPVIALNSDGLRAEQNGFSWRAKPEQVEIHGESDRGLCNGIYSFLSALGISWPGPGQETLPVPRSVNTGGSVPEGALLFPLVPDKVNEPSCYKGGNSSAVSWQRFVPSGDKTISRILKKSEAFAAWAARQQYDALIFPLRAFASGSTGRKIGLLKKYAGEYGIAVEAGGRDLSALVPRKYFFLHRDFFRMEEGRRKKVHQFCPTNPGTIRLIESEGGSLFRSAKDVQVFHLWPDKGFETTWCSCPTCRAFTPSEQNRIGVNAAADVLAALNPAAVIGYFEKTGEEGNITMRKNTFRMEELPIEKEL